MTRFIGVATALLASICFATVSASALPTMSLSPTSGHPKVITQVSGSGFGPGKAVDIYWDTTDELLVIADGSGNIANTPLKVSADALPGQHWVTAIERDDGDGAQKAFTVRTTWVQYGFTESAQRHNPYENVISPSNVNSLGLAWQVEGGGTFFSSPAISNGVAYVGATDGKLYAFNTSSGALKWSASTGSAISGSSPAVSGGIVYIGSLDGKLYAFSASNGTLRWSAATGSSIYSSPDVANGVVYVGSYDSKLYAFNATSGASIWSYATGGPIYHSFPAIANGIVYIGSEDAILYALNATTGTKIWSYQTNAGIDSPPVVANGAVYIENTAGNVWAFNASTGVNKWLNGVLADSSLAVANGTVYAGAGITPNGKLYALNAATGAQRWVTVISGTPTYSSPAIANGVAYIGADSNTIAVDVTNGNILWTAPIGTPYASPTVVDGFLYADGSQDNNLYAFALDGGNDAAYLRNAAPPLFASLHPDRSLKPAKRAHQN